MVSVVMYLMRRGQRGVGVMMLGGGRGSPSMRCLTHGRRSPVSWTNGERRRSEILCNGRREGGRCPPSTVSRCNLGLYPIMYPVLSGCAPLVDQGSVTKLRNICPRFSSLDLHLLVLYVDIMFSYSQIYSILGSVGEETEPSSLLLLL